MKNPDNVKLNHTAVVIIENILFVHSEKNNCPNDSIELIKKIIVDNSSLSIIFLSVPNSCNAIINFEFEKAGIKEK